MPETVAHCEDATYIQFMRDLAQATTVGSLNVLYDRRRVRGVALRTGLDGLTADPLPSLSAYRAFPTPGRLGGHAQREAQPLPRLPAVPHAAGPQASQPVNDKWSNRGPA